MTFWHTEKVGYALLVVCLVTPFNVMIQIVSAEDVMVVMWAPLWQYVWSSMHDASFAVSPFGLFFIIWFWPSVYAAKIAYDAAKTQKLSRYQYAKRVVLLLAIQLLIAAFLPMSSGTPTPTNLPLPITGVVALLLTKFTVPELTSPWDEQESFVSD